jgi:DNA-binding GntR family transcriptional regulator
VSGGSGHGHHAELISYVANGDVDGAEKWLRKHLKEVSAGVDEILFGDVDPDKGTKHTG